ncbi:MAG: translation elongation factor Ts [Candidatus Moranbacteria bacterium]|nr:translation elongation factor Ts [Candidatus Moranbacteria bacterium]
MGEIKITAELVKTLRDQTGASIMECRNALVETEGDLEKAVESLRRRGKEKARKKAGRETGEGVVATYVHGNGKIGAMVELLCETDFVAKNSEFQELAHDLAMHIAAANPKYLSIEDVSAEEKDEFEKVAREEFANEKKPAEILEKIIAGKTAKHFEEMSLLAQPFVKDPDVTVDELIKEKIAKIGENIKVEKFSRLEI